MEGRENRVLVGGPGPSGIFVNNASDVGLLEQTIAAAGRWAEAGEPAADDAPMRMTAAASGMAPLFIHGVQAARTR